MAFVTFMQSWAGRVLRVVAGALVASYGTTQLTGTAGVLLAAFGVVPIAAGLFNFCLVGPAFGLTLMGRRAAARS